MPHRLILHIGNWASAFFYAGEGESWQALAMTSASSGLVSVEHVLQLRGGKVPLSLPTPPLPQEEKLRKRASLASPASWLGTISSLTSSALPSPLRQAPGPLLSFLVGTMSPKGEKHFLSQPPASNPTSPNRSSVGTAQLFQAETDPISRDEDSLFFFFPPHILSWAGPGLSCPS